MKTLTFLVSLVFLFSCGKKKPADPVSSHNISLVIGNPVNIGLNDILLFPVGGNYNPKITEAEKQEIASGDGKSVYQYAANASSASMMKNETGTLYDRHSSGEYINSREEDFDIRNILFYDKVKGGAYPITKDTLHILSFSIHNEYKNPLIFFRIVKKDINGDEKYNSKDAVMLYVSNLQGKNLVQVTPENEQFYDYYYYPETNTILVKTAIDIDKDKIFTSSDETNFREMKIEAPAFGREIFTQSLKDSLRTLMNQ